MSAKTRKGPAHPPLARESVPASSQLQPPLLAAAEVVKLLDRPEEPPEALDPVYATWLPPWAALLLAPWLPPLLALPPEPELPAPALVPVPLDPPFLLELLDALAPPPEAVPELPPVREEEAEAPPAAVPDEPPAAPPAPASVLTTSAATSRRMLASRLGPASGS